MENSEDFINYEKGKITSVFSCGYNRAPLIRNIIANNKKKKIMVFGRGSEFYPAMMHELYFGMDIIEDFKELARYFDFFIFDYFLDKHYKDEIEAFFKFLKTDRRAKNKTIILFFKQDFETAKKHATDIVDSFYNTKDMIFENSDFLYSIQPVPLDLGDRNVWLSNLKTFFAINLKRVGDYPHSKYEQV